MTTEFKTGETVSLRSGGAVMTVRIHITGQQAAEQGWPKDAGYVSCDWLDVDGKSNNQRFHPDQIERVMRFANLNGGKAENVWAFSSGFPVGAPLAKAPVDPQFSAEFLASLPETEPLVFNKIKSKVDDHLGLSGQ
jgi:uncharacterized protein YodC (DUF2158 family)